MAKILDEVMKGIPADTKISDAVFEGANIVLYTKDKDFFLDNSGVIREIVNSLKKRVELRADPSVVMDIEDTTKIIKKIMPEDAGEINILFDPQRSIVIIESEKPGIAIGKGGDVLKEIKKKTLWTPIVRRVPPMRSKIIENIRQVLYDLSDYRRKFLHKVGKRIYEGWTRSRRDEWVRITCLGSAREVGRSCFLLQTPESRVILDCGFNVAAPKDLAYPYLDAPEFKIEDLDAVVLCHSHIDHCLPPDTPVELEGGIIKPIDEIEEGDKLLTVNWKTGKKEIGECLKKVRTYTHKEITKIKTPYYSIEASPNHKFFVVEDMEVKEIEAKDLKEGMIIPCDNYKNHHPQNIEIIEEQITNFNSHRSFTILKDMEHKLNFFKFADIGFQKITKIERCKNEYDYLVDLKVSDNSNFIANGVVVHNCGTVPFLYKMGFRGPTYCTDPCRDVTALMCLDLIEIAEKEGNEAPYGVKDVKEFVKHTICLEYEEVSDITPDIRLTLYNAGHTLGSALAHLHIGNGLHNFVYSSDFNYETSNLLASASTIFPRVESIMMESTYGTRSDNTPTRKQSEDDLIRIINEVAEQKGKVLMPVLGVGRSQELMLILERAMREKRIPQMPVYIQGMVWDINAIHTAYPDYLAPGIKREIFQKDHNPFLSEIFKRIVSQKEMEEVKEGKGPYVIMATSGMMQGGPALSYFKHFAENPKNALVFTCYQGVGSIGRRIQEGEREISFVAGGTKKQETVKVLMRLETLGGFSGHSSFKQLMGWVGHLEPRPKKIITVHGDYSRCIELASALYQQYRIETIAPKNLETIRLR